MNIFINVSLSTGSGLRRSQCGLWDSLLSGGQHLAPASRRPHLRLRRSVRARPRPRPPSHWASSSDSSFNATAFLVVVPLLAGLAVVGVYIAHHLKLQAVWAVEGVNEVLLS